MIRERRDPVPANAAVQESAEPDNRREGVPTPLLRLQVDPSTNVVHVADNVDKTSDPADTSAAPSVKLQLHNDTPGGLHDHGDYTEVWASHVEGEQVLSWGEKRAKDDSWRSRWIQQAYDGSTQVEDFEHPVVLTGRASGTDVAQRRSWREAWFWVEHSDGSVEKTTFKSVGKVDISTQTVAFDGEREEDVNETTTLSDSVSPGGAAPRKDVSMRVRQVEKWDEVTVEKDGIIEITRRGEDCRGRRWTFRSTGSEEEFDEKNAGLSRGYKRTKADGVTEERTWFESKDETWTDSHFADGSGKRWGRKSGRNCKGEEWGETWRDEDESRDVDRWVFGEVSRGERFGVGGNEEYSVNWTKWDGFHRTEKWWKTRGEDNEWGEVSEGESLGDVERTTKEKWSRNSQEESVESTTVRERRSSGILNRVEREGFNRCRRCGDAAWGSAWKSTRIPRAEASVEPLLPGRAPVTSRPEIRKHGEQALTEEDGMVVSEESHEKWWLEEDGNTWGEKSRCDRLAMTTETETWYRNPRGEYQSDVRVTFADGTQQGAKEGHREENGERVEWSENWSEVSGQTRVAKLWAERSARGESRWGEQTTVEGPSSRQHNWSHSHVDGEERRFERTIARHSREETTETKLEVLREGEVVDWFDEVSGQRFATRESWVVRSGRNARGEWRERWHNAPTQQSAAKSGANDHGDVWSERWAEVAEIGDERKEAHKQGHNAHGDAWEESWMESTAEAVPTKHAKKAGRNNEGQWYEEWHESADLNWTHKEGQNENQKWVEAWGQHFGNSWDRKFCFDL